MPSPNTTVPKPFLATWPMSAADALYVRAVLAQNPHLEYGLFVHDYAPTAHAHVVFSVRSARAAA